MGSKSLAGRRLAWLSIVGVSLGAAYACNEYDESLLLPGETGGTGGTVDGGGGVSGGTGGGPDKTPFWHEKAANGCDTEGMPTADQRPTTADSDDLPPLYLGMITMGFGSAKNDKARTPDPEVRNTVGFDIDGRCTDSTTCTGQAAELGCKNDNALPDGDQCRDNAFGGVISKMAEIPELVPYGYTEAHWNCGLLHGEFMQMFKLTGYNGTLNDPQVRVDMYSSDGADGLAHDICGSTGSNIPSDWYDNVAWLEFDPFRVSKRYLTKQSGFEMGTLPDSIYADASAYVRNGYLIVQLPDPFEIWLTGERSYGHTAGIRLLIHRGVIAGKLELNFQTENWSISEGTLGGVIAPSDFISNLKEVGVCGNLCGAEQPLLDYINQHADALVAGDPNPDANCDGLSLGMQFTAKEILPGPIFDPQVPAECSQVPSDAPPLNCGCPCIPMGGAGGTGGTAGTGGTGGTSGGTGGTGGVGGATGGAAGTGGSN
ncbi:MAG: hypothetical protein H6718_20800 [Polyangiaceae bacterium]|nr:hypothetical protein [Polyangiaceae bacterium]